MFFSIKSHHSSQRNVTIWQRAHYGVMTLIINSSHGNNLSLSNLLTDVMCDEFFRKIFYHNYNNSNGNIC